MITVNGKPQQYVAGTVQELLEQQGFSPAAAVERNGEILPRKSWQRQRLSDGDVYEIICFVGGG